MVLSLRYRDLNNTISETRRLADSLDQYANRLRSPVQRDIRSVEGGTSHPLNSADFFVSRKIQQIETRSRNARILQTRIQTLHDTAQRVDRDVSRIIDPSQSNPSRTRMFLSAIGTRLAGSRVVGWVMRRTEGKVNALRTLGQNIRTWWREGGRDIVLRVLAIVGAVLLVVAVVAAIIFTGGLALKPLAALALKVAKVALGGALSGSVLLLADAIRGEMSSWQTYFATITMGALTAGLIPGAGPGASLIARAGIGAGKGAISGGGSTAIRYILKRFTDENYRDMSLREILGRTAINAFIGGTIGFVIGCVAAQFTKKTDGNVRDLKRLQSAFDGIKSADPNQLSFADIATDKISSIKNEKGRNIPNLMLDLIGDMMKKPMEIRAANIDISQILIPVIPLLNFGSKINAQLNVRLSANITKSAKHIKIPTYIVGPDWRPPLLMPKPPKPLSIKMPEIWKKPQIILGPRAILPQMNFKLPAMAL